jgi:hypothetical protein
MPTPPSASTNKSVANYAVFWVQAKQQAYRLGNEIIGPIFGWIRPQEPLAYQTFLMAFLY